MKIDIEEILTENEDINGNNDTKVQGEEFQDEVMKLRMALEEKERQHLSLLAGFDNLKKRIDRDSRLRVQEEKGELIGRVLEVLDNLERAIDSAKNYRHDPFFEARLFFYFIFQYNPKITFLPGRLNAFYTHERSNVCDQITVAVNINPDCNFKLKTREIIKLIISVFIKQFAQIHKIKIVRLELAAFPQKLFQYLLFYPNYFYRQSKSLMAQY